MENAYDIDIKGIENAIHIGHKIQRECISQGISAFTYLLQKIPVYEIRELEEGLYGTGKQLIGIIHDNQNEMSVLQVLAMLEIPYLRYAKGENADLQIVGFIEGFKGTTSFSSYCCPEYKEIPNQNLFHRGS